MKARLLEFGSIAVDGLRYEHDIVIDGGTVRKRKKKPSKPYRSEFGHTPLSAHEELPWRGSQLIIGTGAYRSLPITPNVNEEADRRGVTLIAVPTREACQLISDLDPSQVHAVLHGDMLTARHPITCHPDRTYRATTNPGVPPTSHPIRARKHRQE